MSGKPIITFGHSPDADDAFMFYALAKGLVKIDGHEVGHEMQDIQSLNTLASEGNIPVTAISAAHYPAVASKYRIMSCGASVGRNYGPTVVSTRPMKESELEGAVIAVPGRHTTSWMLYRIFAPKFGSAKFVDFDEVGPVVQRGEADAGILLHEGQILYEKLGFKLVLDLGKRWFEETGLPIPLGLDLVNRKLGDDLAQQVTDALKASIVHARTYEDEALEYALAFGRGIDREDGRRFVRMYVNDDTVDMGEDGRRALQTLYAKAGEKGILGVVPDVDIVQAR